MLDAVDVLTCLEVKFCGNRQGVIPSYYSCHCCCIHETGVKYYSCPITVSQLTTRLYPIPCLPSTLDTSAEQFSLTDLGWLQL